MIARTLSEKLSLLGTSQEPSRNLLGAHAQREAVGGATLAARVGAEAQHAAGGDLSRRAPHTPPGVVSRTGPGQVPDRSRPRAVGASPRALAASRLAGGEAAAEGEGGEGGRPRLRGAAAEATALLRQNEEKAAQALPLPSTEPTPSAPRSTNPAPSTHILHHMERDVAVALRPRPPRELSFLATCAQVRMLQRSLDETRRELADLKVLGRTSAPLGAPRRISRLAGLSRCWSPCSPPSSS